MDEGGPDLKQGVIEMPGKDSKLQKPGVLYMGEAPSPLQRGKEGKGEAEDDCLERVLCMRAAAGERGMQREFPPLSHHDPCEHCDLFSTSHNTTDTSLCSRKDVGGEAELGERVVRMLMLLMRRLVAQPYPVWPECFCFTTCSL